MTDSVNDEELREAAIKYKVPVIHTNTAETAIISVGNEGRVRRKEIDVSHKSEITISRLLSKGFQAIARSDDLGNPQEAGETILNGVIGRSAE